MWCWSVCVVAGLLAVVLLITCAAVIFEFENENFDFEKPENEFENVTCCVIEKTGFCPKKPVFCRFFTDFDKGTPLLSPAQISPGSAAALYYYIYILIYILYIYYIYTIYKPY